MQIMQSLPKDYRAVVIGSTGGLGRAFLELLGSDARCAKVIGFSRNSDPPLDLLNEASIEKAAASLEDDVHLVINATGFLHDDGIKPEKSIRSLNPEAFARLFELNATGPALLLKHFTKRLVKGDRSLFASLSARVGSIGDNALGGWYAYRASKAAQNMIIKCAAIEIARTRPEAALVALHPGTVETPLSDPFSRNRTRLSPQQSARGLLEVLDGTSADETGSFLDYKGDRIEW